MSHIRPVKSITEVCRTCQRDGYVHTVYTNLMTEAEFKERRIGERIPPVDNLPAGYEMMYAKAGSSIGESIREAKDYCVEYGVFGVAFEFNGKPVLVTGLSDVEQVYRGWWQAVYNETPEQSAARH